MAGASSSVYAGVNYGLQLGSGDVIDPVFRIKNTQVEPDYSSYLRALQAEPEELRTTAIESTSSGIIDSCWQWILGHSTYLAWKNGEGTQLLWIHGVPGAGKTVVMVGLVDELAQATPGSSRTPCVLHHFCHGMNDRANSAVSILRSLVFGLVQRQPDLVHHLRYRYKFADDVKKARVRDLWNILRGMLVNFTRYDTLYVAVDALDECRKDEGIIELLELVKREPFKLPHGTVKWVFGSRHSPEIHDVIVPGDSRHSINLDDEIEVLVGVRTFINNVVRDKSRWSESTRDAVRQFLLENSGRTYIYASLVWKELRETLEGAVPDRIQELTENFLSSELERVYARLMQRLVGEDERSGDTRLQDILRTVLLGHRPLSPREIAIAAGVPRNPDAQDYELSQLEDLVQKCGDLLSLRNGKVYILHMSVRDYLTARTGDAEPFLSEAPRSDHARIAQHCLAAMLSTLRNHDFATIESVIERQSSQEVVQRYNNVAYVYCYWFRHLAQAGSQFSDLALVEKFFEERFLAWVEVMAHMDKILDCIQIVQELTNEVLPTLWPAHSSLRNTAYDSLRFLLRYRGTLEHDPTQAHFLARFFSPETSATRLNCQKLGSPCCVTVAGVGPDHWGPQLHMIHEGNYDWGQERGTNISRKRVLGFSKDGKSIFMASRGRGRNIVQWGVTDGLLLGMIEWTEDEIAISRDGTLLASISSSGDIGVWDTESRRQLCTLAGHPPNVVAACFSPCGSTIAAAFINDYFQIFTVTAVVKLWDAKTGRLVKEISLRRIEAVCHLEFSPEGHRLAVCFKKGGVAVWDVAQDSVYDIIQYCGGQEVVYVLREDALAIACHHGTIVWHIDSQSMTHWWHGNRTNSVTLIAVADDGQTTALKRDGCIEIVKLQDLLTLDRPSMIRLYSDTATRGEEEDKFRTESLSESLAFSPGANYLSWVRDDGRVMVWDLHKLSESRPENGRKLSGIRTPLTFSPDGKLCGTSNTRGLELWDLTTRSRKVNLVGAPARILHMCEDLPWGFSPKGELAIAVLDETLIIVDTTTAGQDGGQFRYSKAGGIVSVDAFAFNHTNTLVALANNRTGRVYLVDPASGSVSRILDAPGRLGGALAFSGMGKLVATSKLGSPVLYLWGRPFEDDDCVVFTSRLLDGDDGPLDKLMCLGSDLGWHPAQMVFPSDENTVVVAWSLVKTDVAGLGRRRTSQIARLFVTTACLDDPNRSVQLRTDTEITRRHVTGTGGGVPVTSFAVSEECEFAMARDNKVTAQIQKGTFRLTTNLGRISSLRFGPGNQSIIANGRTLALKEPWEEVDAGGVQLGRVPETGNADNSRNWVMWNGRPVVCIPDHDSVRYHEVWGPHLALVYWTGYVTIFSVSSLGLEGN